MPGGETRRVFGACARVLGVVDGVCLQIPANKLVRVGDQYKPEDVAD